MSNVIILGDPHVGKNISLGKTTIGAALNSRVSDQFALLDWTLEQAVEHHADHIIITGDCFEEVKTHPSLIAMFMSWLKKCQVHDVSVHIIEGNHDILRNGFIYFSPLDIITEADLDLIHIYKDINTIIIDTTAFTLVPFRDRKSFSVNSNAEAISLVRDSLVYELASIPTTYHKALIGHLAIEGSIPVGDEIDDLTNELFCPLDMFKDYDFVIMGHIHAPQVMQKVNPYIAHIGSMDISNFGETDHKKHIIIFDCSTGQWKQENLPTRPLQKIIISIPKDTEDTTAYVLQEIEKTGIQDKAIVRVEIALTTPELKSVNKSIIDKYLSDSGASNIAGISETKKINLIKKDNNNVLDTKMDIIAAIKMYAQTYIEESLRSAFIELSMETHNNFKLEEKN
jgi:DNA repair exonuclease SbcCD nuclease subunit